MNFIFWCIWCIGAAHFIDSYNKGDMLPIALIVITIAWFVNIMSDFLRKY